MLFNKCYLSKNMAYFIDLEALYDNNGNYIIKELCIMNVYDILNPLHFVFKLPWFIQTVKTYGTNLYLMRYRHGLSWFEGRTTFQKANIERMLSKNSIYYVKDAVDGQKIRTLKECFPSLRIVNYSPTKLQSIPTNTTCPWRNHGSNCAYKNVYNWLRTTFQLNKRFVSLYL